MADIHVAVAKENVNRVGFLDLEIDVPLVFAPTGFDIKDMIYFIEIRMDILICYIAI